jgi:hypothetical protein
MGVCMGAGETLASGDCRRPVSAIGLGIKVGTRTYRLRPTSSDASAAPSCDQRIARSAGKVEAELWELLGHLRADELEG